MNTERPRAHEASVLSDPPAVGGTGQADRTREKERDFSEMCTRCRMRYGLHIGEDCQDRKGTFTQIPPAVVSPAPLDLSPISTDAWVQRIEVAIWNHYGNTMTPWQLQRLRAVVGEIWRAAVSGSAPPPDKKGNR